MRFQEDEKLEIQLGDQEEKLEDWNPGKDPVTEYCRESEDPEIDGKDYDTIRDSVTGDLLPSKLVEKAHDEEIMFMNDWKVGDLVPMSQAKARTGEPPLRGKWVNVNKQDEANPLIRSRYVACEVNTYRDESLFAATPPLEALRLLLSQTAIGPRNGKNKRKILLIDVKKAHLHATAVREIYVQLPFELRSKYLGMCWKLRRCLYGTRDAPKM